MKYVCFGAGATGAIIGAFPAFAGQEVWFVDPNAAHMGAIERDGLEVRMSPFDDPGRQTVRRVSVHARTEAAEIGRADVVIVMTKSCDTMKAIESVRAVTDSRTILITLQNGLGNIELLGGFFDRDRIVYGYTTISSVIVRPGVIASRMPAYHHVVLGSDCAALRPEVESVLSDFRAGGCDIEYDEEIGRAIWEKAAMNCGANGISALLQLTARECFSHQEFLDIYNAIIREVDSVAAAKGLYLDQTVIYRNGLAAQPVTASAIPDTPCSMVQDVLAGRQTEIEFLNGAVVREGKRLNVPTPLNDMVYKLISVYERSYGERLKRTEA